MVKRILVVKRVSYDKLEIPLDDREYRIMSIIVFDIVENKELNRKNVIGHAPVLSISKIMNFAKKNGTFYEVRFYDFDKNRALIAFTKEVMGE